MNVGRFAPGRGTRGTRTPAGRFLERHLRVHPVRFQQDALRANVDIVARIRQIAERIGATPVQVALAWVLAQGQYVIPIPGT